MNSLSSSNRFHTNKVRNIKGNTWLHKVAKESNYSERLGQIDETMLFVYLKLHRVNKQLFSSSMHPICAL
jgi:uncharacterized protein YihD (DUF1040 family)